MDEMLSTTEVGKLMGRTRQTVEWWIRERGLPAHVQWQGRRKIYRIRRSDLREFALRWREGL